jgi:hypothetical protein
MMMTMMIPRSDPCGFAQALLAERLLSAVKKCDIECAPVGLDPDMSAPGQDPDMSYVRDPDMSAHTGQDPDVSCVSELEGLAILDRCTSPGTPIDGKWRSLLMPHHYTYH